jgi:hypothetical protein
MIGVERLNLSWGQMSAKQSQGGDVSVELTLPSNGWNDTFRDAAPARN